MYRVSPTIRALLWTLALCLSPTPAVHAEGRPAEAPTMRLYLLHPSLQPPATLSPGSASSPGLQAHHDQVRFLDDPAVSAALRETLYLERLHMLERRDCPPAPAPLEESTDRLRLAIERLDFTTARPLMAAGDETLRCGTGQIPPHTLATFLAYSGVLRVYLGLDASERFEDALAFQPGLEFEDESREVREALERARQRVQARTPVAVQLEPAHVGTIRVIGTRPGKPFVLREGGNYLELVVDRATVFRYRLEVTREDRGRTLRWLPEQLRMPSEQEVLERLQTEMSEKVRGGAKRLYVETVLRRMMRDPRFTEVRLAMPAPHGCDRIEAWMERASERVGVSRLPGQCERRKPPYKLIAMAVTAAASGAVYGYGEIRLAQGDFATLGEGMALYERTKTARTVAGIGLAGTVYVALPRLFPGHVVARTSAAPGLRLQAGEGTIELSLGGAW